MEPSNPKPSSEAAHRRMKAAKPRDTLPEMLLRLSLDKLGMKYEVDTKPINELQRKADILIREKKIAIFVDGCFWHGCPTHGTIAKANSEFWAAKIKKNQERDKDTEQKLTELGWTVIRFWEHENPDEAAIIIADMANKQSNEK